MYNLNLSGMGGAASGNLLSVAQGESSCTTPRTPEILASLVAMSNPFDSYRGGGHGSGPRLASSPPSGSDTNSSSSGSPACMSPPSVQHTCSQLIKEGLKHTIQSKRKNNNNAAASGAGLLVLDDYNKVSRSDEVSRDSLGDDDGDDDYGSLAGDGLTPEDEERRRRRRERNKIAATKCRLKKRERTVNLVQESEILENQNHDLKSQIQELETQRRRLVDMLTVHRPSCTKHPPPDHPTPNIPLNANSELQTYHHHESSGSCSSRSSSTVETVVYQRVNISSACSRPASVIDSSMSYRRLQISSEYQQRPQVSTTPKEIIAPNGYEETAGTQSPYQPSAYHNYDDNNIVKEESPVWRSNSGASIDTQYGRLSTTDSGYSCQQSLTGLDSPMHYMPSEDGSPYSRHASALFSRPTSLDVSTSDYDSNVEVLDSPTVPPPYHHYDETDNHFCAGFPPDNRGGCIS